MNHPLLMTQHDFVLRCNKVGAIPVDKYTGSNKYMKFRCTQCQSIYRAKPRNVWQHATTKCRGCSRGGYNKLSAVYYNQIKRHAEDNDRLFNISIKELWDLFVKQNRKCALTDKPITLEIKRTIQTASLDRIDSNGDYTIDNVQWLHKDINRLKNNYTQEQFVGMCIAVANHCKNKESCW